MMSDKVPNDNIEGGSGGSGSSDHDNALGRV